MAVKYAQALTPSYGLATHRLDGEQQPIFVINVRFRQNVLSMLSIGAYSGFGEEQPQSNDK